MLASESGRGDDVTPPSQPHLHRPQEGRRFQGTQEMPLQSTSCQSQVPPPPCPRPPTAGWGRAQPLGVLFLLRSASSPGLAQDSAVETPAQLPKGRQPGNSYFGGLEMSAATGHGEGWGPIKISPLQPLQHQPQCLSAMQSQLAQVLGCSLME